MHNYDFSGTHKVFNLNWKNENSGEFAVSFLLPKNHGLDSTTHLFVIDPIYKILLFYVSLTAKSMQSEVITNPHLFQFTPPLTQSNSPHVIRCYEENEGYVLDIGMRKIKLQSSKGC